MCETQGRKGEDSIFDLKVNLERRLESLQTVVPQYFDASFPTMGSAQEKKKNKRVRDRQEGDEVVANFGSSLGLTQRQLEELASSVTPAAVSHRRVTLRAASATHAGVKGSSGSTLDFDKVSRRSSRPTGVVLVTLCCHAGDLAALSTALLTDNDKDCWLNSPYSSRPVLCWIILREQSRRARGQCERCNILCICW